MITFHPHRAQRMTGERPREGVTPDSLLALHDAGYEAVGERLDRLGQPWRREPRGGRRTKVLDVGCGEGFETRRLVAPSRFVVGVDVDAGAAVAAAAAGAAAGFSQGAGAVMAVARMDALSLGVASGTFDAVCSSHVLEHFGRPEQHVAEVARVLADEGEAYFLTPNAPADFENPFHLRLFDPAELRDVLAEHFGEVWVGGVDASEAVKADFAARRAKAERLLRLDVFDVRHRIPRQWYLAIYTRLLPLAYRLLARHDAGGASGITAADWFVTGDVDKTTLVLFAVCAKPRRAGGTR